MQVKSPRDKQVLRNCALKTIVGYSIFDRLESDLQTYSSFLVQQTRLTLTDFTVYWDIWSARVFLAQVLRVLAFTSEKGKNAKADRPLSTFPLSSARNQNLVSVGVHACSPFSQV